jgi:hypothetical protein
MTHPSTGLIGIQTSTVSVLKSMILTEQKNRTTLKKISLKMIYFCNQIEFFVLRFISLYNIYFKNLILAVPNENAPFCVACNENFTVKHFFLECHDFSQARNRFYRVNSLKELFNTIPSKKNIIDYLKEINLHSRI